MDEIDTKVSKYNSAVAQLIRMDTLWQDCHKHSRAGNYAAWNTDLDKIYSELVRDLHEGTPKEKEISKKFNEYIKRISEVGSAVNKIEGFNKQSDYQKSSQWYIILLEKEIWLGRLQNELGKGTKWDDSDDEETE